MRGIFTGGSAGEAGNAGIVVDGFTPSFGPPHDDDGTFQDGVYAINMQFTKCSILFHFDLDGEFDPSLFEEVSTAITVPDVVQHGTYRHLDYRVIASYSYNGTEIEQANDPEKFIHRGFHAHLMFFVTNSGNTYLLYSNYNGNEERASAETLKLLEASI